MIRSNDANYLNWLGRIPRKLSRRRKESIATIIGIMMTTMKSEDESAGERKIGIAGEKIAVASVAEVVIITMKIEIAEVANTNIDDVQIHIQDPVPLSKGEKGEIVLADHENQDQYHRIIEKEDGQ